MDLNQKIAGQQAVADKVSQRLNVPGTERAVDPMKRKDDPPSHRKIEDLISRNVGRGRGR